jgi:hypothetical protein
MLAFSQISANGAAMTTAIKGMEAEIQEKKKKEQENQGMQYDDAVAAYAEFMSGEGPEEVDPKKEEEKKKKAAADKKAKEELEGL